MKPFLDEIAACGSSFVEIAACGSSFVGIMRLLRGAFDRVLNYRGFGCCGYDLRIYFRHVIILDFCAVICYNDARHKFKINYTRAE